MFLSNIFVYYIYVCLQDASQLPSVHQHPLHVSMLSCVEFRFKFLGQSFAIKAVHSLSLCCTAIDTLVSNAAFTCAYSPNRPHRSQHLPHPSPYNSTSHSLVFVQYAFVHCQNSSVSKPLLCFLQLPYR